MLAKERQALLKKNGVQISFQDALEYRSLVQLHISLEEVSEIIERLSQNGPHAVQEHIMTAYHNGLHVQHYHRERVPVGIELVMIGDLEAVEPRVALVLQIEEGIQHREVEGLPEPPRTGEKENTVTIGVDDVGDEHGLVHIALVLLADAREGLPADIDLPHIRRMVRRRK